MEESIKIKKENKIIYIHRGNIELDILTYHKFGVEFSNLISSDTDLYVVYDASLVTVDVPGEVKLAMAEWLKENRVILRKNVTCSVLYLNQ